MLSCSTVVVVRSVDDYDRALPTRVLANCCMLCRSVGGQFRHRLRTVLCSVWCVMYSAASLC